MKLNRRLKPIQIFERAIDYIVLISVLITLILFVK